MPLLNVTSKIFVRKPYSLAFDGIVETAIGAVSLASEIQHPSIDRMYFTDGTELRSVNIATRSAPVVAAAAAFEENDAIGGLAFDSTSRYLYATDGATELHTLDLGASFSDAEVPNVIATETDLSQGNGFHALNRIGSDLYSLADTVTNNSFQKYSLATPSNPALSSTTAITGHDLEALIGHPNTALDTILYPASDSSGKILVVPIASPGSFTVLQLPTLGGFQIRCTSGIVFSPNDEWMVLPCFFVNGTINHYFWLVYDVSDGYSTALARCSSEDVVNGAIASKRSPFICSTPRHVFSQGMFWNDGSNVLHIATTIRDDSFAADAELRFYAWGANGDYSRIPRVSGGVTIPGAYSIRARNDGADKSEWLCAGVSKDRTNIVVALATSDLLPAGQSTASFFDLTPDARTEGQELEYGMQGAGVDARMSDTGTFVFDVDNSEVNSVSNLGGYSPDSASPITPHFVDGAVLIHKKNTGAGDEIDFYGTITDLKVTPGRYREDDRPRDVRVICQDAMELLERTKVEQLPLRTNITVEEALRTLWDRVPYKPGTEVLRFQGEESSEVLAYTADQAYDEKTSVASYIKSLIKDRGFFIYRHYGSDRGFTYISNDSFLKGSVYFGGAAPIALDTAHLWDMEPERATSNIYNIVSVRYYPREVDASSVVLFTLAERIRIKAGETVSIDVQLRDPAGLASRVAGADLVYPVVGYPTANTDWNFRAQKNGSGTNLNAQVSVSAELYVATNPRIIAANAGPEHGWFFTQLRGKGVYTLEPVETVPVIDQASINEHGPRVLVYDARYVSDEATARAIARAILAARKDPRTFLPRIKVPIDSTAISKALGWMGPTRKCGAQEQVTGLQNSVYWVLGTGKLGDTAGADNSNLYGLDVYTVQRTKLVLKSQGLMEAELDLMPEDLVFRVPGWIDPKNDYTDGEPPTKTLFNLHFEENIHALWHEKKASNADLDKASSTVFDDIPNADFPIKAGETWQFEMLLFVDSNTTANAKVTVIAEDENGTDISSLVFGRFGLWAPGAAIGDASRTNLGGALAWTISSSSDETALLSGRLTSPIDCTIKVQGAQNTSNVGITKFRELSPLAPARAERAA